MWLPRGMKIILAATFHRCNTEPSNPYVAYIIINHSLSFLPHKTNVKQIFLSILSLDCLHQGLLASSPLHWCTAVCSHATVAKYWWAEKRETDSKKRCVTCSHTCKQMSRPPLIFNKFNRRHKRDCRRRTFARGLMSTSPPVLRYTLSTQE